MIKRAESFIDWCRRVVASEDAYVILDCETTGKDGEIIDLAVITPKGEKLYDSLLRPLCEIELEAQRVHGITGAMVEGAPTIKEEWEKILAALKGRVIITYNAAFDAERLKQSAWAHRCFPKRFLMPMLPYECAMIRYAAFWDAPRRWKGADPPWQSLSAALEQQGIALPPGLHRAMADCQATLMLPAKIAATGEASRRYKDIKKEENL